MVKTLLERFMKRNCKKQIKQNLEEKNLLKENVINYISNGKAMIVLLIAG